MLNAYKILEEQKVEVIPLLNFEFKNLLDKIYRRLTIKQTIKNPWKVIVEHSIKKRDRRNNIKTIIISFTDIRSLTFHFSKGYNNSNRDARPFLTKSVQDCHLKFTAMENNPVEFVFDCSKNMLTISGSYKVKNRYDNIISF